MAEARARQVPLHAVRAWEPAAKCQVLVVPPPSLTLEASPQAPRRQLRRDLDRL